MARSSPPQLIAAVIFDLDGVLIDSEQVWDEVRERLTGELGGTWHERATRDMMGMSAPEWSAYMHEELGVPSTARRSQAGWSRRWRPATGRGCR